MKRITGQIRKLGGLDNQVSQVTIVDKKGNNKVVDRDRQEFGGSISNKLQALSKARKVSLERITIYKKKDNCIQGR